jgi:hypothetical protein
MKNIGQISIHSGRFAFDGPNGLPNNNGRANFQTIEAISAPRASGVPGIVAGIVSAVIAAVGISALHAMTAPSMALAAPEDAGTVAVAAQVASNINANGATASVLMDP